LPLSTAKKDLDHTKTHTFPFSAQANQTLKYNKTVIERKFVESNDTQLALIPISLPGNDEMLLGMKIAMRLSGHKKNVI
jgi:hypothetical protein